jgi:hypothetical protein
MSSLQTDVLVRLERIKELWRELERTRPTSDRYDALIEVIRTESSAYLAVLETQPDRDRARVRADDPTPPTIAALSARHTIHGRLARVRELWLELEGTRRTSSRYAALVDMIHAESLAGDFDGLQGANDPRKPAR